MHRSIRHRAGAPRPAWLWRLSVAVVLTVILFAMGASVGAAAAQDPAAAVTGVSRSFNPAISANALFLGMYASDVVEPAGHDEAGAEHEHEAHGHGVGQDSGLRVQEVELQLTSMVDAYLKADLILAVPGGEGIELEEGTVTTQGLPGGLLVRAGRMYAELGRHNRLHSHQYPFLDPPLVNERLLGGEGLAEAGISVSWLSPLPWYLEITGQVLDGSHELFASDDGNDLLYLGHAKGFWELGDATTLELGGSGATGANAYGEVTTLYGLDLTWKWRPLVRSRDRSLTWQSEYLRARIDEGPETHDEGGLYSLLQVQWARRWWVQGRWDLYGVPKEAAERDWRASALLAFVPSEFSALRLQASRLRVAGQDVNQVLLQLNITVGSHPAHRY